MLLCTTARHGLQIGTDHLNPVFFPLDYVTARLLMTPVKIDRPSKKGDNLSGLRGSLVPVALRSGGGGEETLVALCRFPLPRLTTC